MGAELQEIVEAYKWIINIAKAKNFCSHSQEAKYLGMRMQISTTDGVNKAQLDQDIYFAAHKDKSHNHNPQ